MVIALFRDDGAVIGGIGWLGDQVVTVLLEFRAQKLQDNLNCNLDKLYPEGYRKPSA